MRNLLLLLSFLLLASSSNAEVIVRKVDLVLSNPQEEITIDLDKNGSVDFVLFYDVLEDEAFLHINVPSSLQMTNKVVVTGEHNTFGKDLVAKLPVGYKIYEGSEYNGQIFGNGPLMAQPDFAGNNILEGRGVSIVGFSFKRNGETHYGWMSVQVNAAGTEAKVSALAYESIADRPILAGAVPMSVGDSKMGPMLRRVSSRIYELEEVAMEIVLVDLLGREVLHLKESKTLDLSGLAAGGYLVRVESIHGQYSSKVELH